MLLWEQAVSQGKRPGLRLRRFGGTERLCLLFRHRFGAGGEHGRPFPDLTSFSLLWAVFPAFALFSPSSSLLCYCVSNWAGTALSSLNLSFVLFPCLLCTHCRHFALLLARGFSFQSEMRTFVEKRGRLWCTFVLLKQSFSDRWNTALWCTGRAEKDLTLWFFFCFRKLFHLHCRSSKVNALSFTQNSLIVLVTKLSQMLSSVRNFSIFLRMHCTAKVILRDSIAYQWTWNNNNMFWGIRNWCS